MNPNALVPVGTSKIAGINRESVDARALWSALGVGRDFSSWIRERIISNNFELSSTISQARLSPTAVAVRPSSTPCH